MIACIRDLRLPLSQRDLEIVSDIHWQSAQRAYAYRKWRYSMQDVIDWYAEKSDAWDWGRIALLTSHGDEGLAVAFAVARENLLDQLFVFPKFQRSGIGGRLLQAMFERDLETIDVHVLEGNKPARKFYERHGFRLQKSWWDSDEREMNMLYRRKRMSVPDKE